MALPSNVQDAADALELYNYGSGDAYDFSAPAYGYVILWPQALNEVAVAVNYIGDILETLVTSSDSTITNIIALSQAQYLAIASPDATTLYVVTDD